MASLDFSAYDEAAVRNALYKAHLLREIIDDFTVALEATVEELRHHRRHSRDS